jgi:4-amino-4-deoxy-L-arabinose transferase-like glycosyltransferase
MENEKLQFKSKKLFKNFKKEISSHKTIYIPLLFVILVSLFLRLFKLNQLLGFWYDQGRDALVIWRFFHEGKFFLIGPVTGIEGIFLGPFYYWLLTPLYFLGGGSPVFVAAILGWLSTLGVVLIYLMGKEVFGREVDLIAAILFGISYYIVTFSRWLANPQPLPLFSLLLIFCLLKIYQGKEKLWLLLGLLTGLALQLEAAGAIFFLPAIFCVVIWRRKAIKSWRLILFGFLIFLITLLPQLIFNFRHQGILFEVFRKFLTQQKAFRISIWEILQSRLSTYYDVFFDKLFVGWGSGKFFSANFFGVLLFFFREKLFGDKKNILWLGLLTPLLGFLFYQGNFGYVWDYYFAGVLLIFLLLFASALGYLWKSGKLGKIIGLSFLTCFLLINGQRLAIYYKTGIGITLRSQLWAIDWIYKDAQKENFNIDVYVPPVIPYAYDYLFKWYGKDKYHFEPVENQVPLLYTLYEKDSEHPTLLADWVRRQEGIGLVIREESCGDIRVQRRKRIIK